MPNNDSRYRYGTQDIPASAVASIENLLIQSSDLPTLHSWIETVRYHHQPISTYRRPRSCARVEVDASTLGHETPASSATADKARYGCHKCHESLKLRKDFIRHMEQKCELVREWCCPTCPKTYRRADHLRAHHKKHHCKAHDCTHVKTAKRCLPEKLALGCGYCIKLLANVRDFLNHLADHFEEGCCVSRWSDTTSIWSLLQDANITPTWDKVCALRFGTVEKYRRPVLSWSADSADEEIRHLEYGIGQQDLETVLAQLLEKGVVHEWPAPMPSLPKSIVDLTGFDVDEAITNQSASQNILTQAVSIHSSGAENAVERDCESLEIVMDFESDASMEVTSHEIASMPTFNTLSHRALDPMDVNYADTIATFATQPFLFRKDESNNHSFGASIPNLSPVEDMIMSSVPLSVIGVGAEAGDPSPPIDRTVAPSDTLYGSYSLDPNNFFNLIQQPIPPFNPTPPLPRRKGHRQSVSGFLSRIIQNMPNIPPT